MGNYNPHRPTILGQEWVGIRSEPYPVDQTVERGYTFVLETNTTVVSGSYFVDDLPPNNGYKAIGMAVYQTGEEALSGPVKKVTIPVDNVVLTPNGADGLSNIVGGGTAVQALASPSDGAYIVIQGDIEVELNFDTAAYNTELTGKRILDVNLVYAFAVTFNAPENFPLFQSFVRGPGGTSFDVNYGSFPPLATSPSTIPQLERLNLGNTNLWLATLGGVVGGQRFPWRNDDIQRFENGATNELMWVLDMDSFGAIPTNDVAAYLCYAALEVVYCEETRLLFGSKGQALQSSEFYTTAITEGQNVVQLRAVDTFSAAGRTLTPGEYTVVVTQAYLGNNVYNIGGNPDLKALRQTEALPSHRGVQVALTTTPGQTFARSEIDVIPQLSLHTASAVVTGVHAYGELVPGTTYGSVEVQPDVVQRSGGAAVAYPQVRFYARRYGETNVPLMLQSTTQATWLVRITAEDFDALPEIVDGWREVTLRFPDAATPTFSDAGTTHTWRWAATGLDAGSRWDVLIPYGPSATSGPYDTSNATYGRATAFTSVGSDIFFGDADATLIFSQDPPAVTGLAVEVLAQSLEPIGEECDLAACVPTALYYHHLTWDARDVLDLFDDRTETTGWHEAPSGQEWTHTNGTPDDYLVTDGSGDMVIDSVNTVYFSLIEASAFNVEVRTRLRLDFVPSGNSVTARVVGRVEDVNNYYEAQLVVTTAGVATLRLTKRVGGTASDISATVTLDGTHAAGDAWNIALRCEADHVLGMAWKEGYPDPLAWQVVGNVLPGDALTGTQTGVAFRAEAGFSGGTVTAHWEEFSATDSDLSGFELQRQDDLDDADEWNTIVRSTGTAVREFNDYEARVGVESRYRIRTLNALDFEGPWSEGTTSALDLPGGSGNFATSPDDASLDVTGDLDLRARIAPDDWTPSADQAIVAKSNPAGNQRQYHLVLRSTGALRLTWSTDGTSGGTTDADSTVATGFADGSTHWVRATLATATGTVKFYTSDDGVVWTQLGSTLTYAPTSIFAGTAPANVGARSGGVTDVFAGLIYSAQIRSGIDGTVVADPRFDQQPLGTTSFTDSTGKVWTINGTAVIVRFPSAAAGTSTLPAPGVAGAGDGNSVLIFTTNERQDGSSNLAYTMVWNGDVTEEFAYREARSVQLHELYRRDFPVAFRPLERGGESFARDLLVQNAAVPSGLLRDGFRSLRDLAWDDVSYVCVRDELGDRWFATVLVPSGSVRRNRRLYVARVEVIEVSDVPSAVDPAVES